jgi:hypothetical protein
VSRPDRTRGTLDKLAAVRAETYDPVRTLYRTLILFAAVGIVILAGGVVEFLYFEPPGQTTGVTARIVGVYQFDQATQKTSGPDRRTFARDEHFAAIVDWSSLPNDITVDARWYNSFQVVVAQVGPGTPTQLADQTVIPVAVPAGLKYNLPGQYILVVERISGDVPVEVLARRIVRVLRT